MSKKDVFTNNRARVMAVKDFCFPDNVELGLKIRAVERSPPKRPKKAGPETILRNENTFVFTLNGLDPEGKKVHEGNKSGWIYCICLRINADTQKVLFFTSNQIQKTKEGKTITAPKVLCFMTYYEYFELFLHSLRVISTLSQMEQKYGSVEPSMDSKTILKKLYETDVKSLSAITVPAVHKLSTKAFSYVLPKGECTERSAVFFCSLLFSMLKAHDVYEILCNIFLEHSVIFVSKNLNLLTSAILGCCALLSPFKWEHIIIPILPSMCLEILEAPVPFLVGIPKSVSEGLRFTKDTWCQQTVVVLLDIGKVYICPPEAEEEKVTKLPLLNGLEKTLELLFQTFEKSRKKSQVLCYHPTTSQIEAIVSASRKVRAAVEKTMLEKLPKQESRKENGTLEMDKICNALMEGTGEVDKEFLKMFGETQMFASYLEDRYKMQAGLVQKVDNTLFTVYYDFCVQSLG
eukprot:TRINITY_DN799_c0_g2_i2.p2 TRINITY_DN799_c0_g2~~TRINITY_DN799_c0_g2_i2.p2  ORF type:complete len:462 (+),score=33.51 TRINITY_DN799_c0_g2_i2:1520-2905(+)